MLFAFNRNRRDSGKAKSVRGGWRDIDDAAAREWPAVVDRHNYRASIAAIGDANPRSERQRAVRGRQCTGIQSGTARSAGSALVGIDRSHAALGIGECGGEGNDLEEGGKRKNQIEFQNALPCLRTT